MQARRISLNQSFSPHRGYGSRTQFFHDPRNKAIKKNFWKELRVTPLHLAKGNTFIQLRARKRLAWKLQEKFFWVRMLLNEYDKKIDPVWSHRHSMSSNLPSKIEGGQALQDLNYGVSFCCPTDFPVKHHKPSRGHRFLFFKSGLIGSGQSPPRLVGVSNSPDLFSTAISKRCAFYAYIHTIFESEDWLVKGTSTSRQEK